MIRLVSVGSVDGSRAVFGPEGEESPYRYTLERVVGPGSKAVLFVMLNPSTATHEVLDPTVRRCVGYARAWGYGRLLVGNLFALRSTDPRVLYAHADPVGPENFTQLVQMAQAADLIVCAWGAHGRYQDQDVFVAAGLRRIQPLTALRLTKDGMPAHPLYLPASLQPAPFEPRRAA